MSDLSDLPPLPGEATDLPSAHELQRLREWACVDDITGLANRRHFLHLAQAAVRQAEAEGGALVLLALRVPRVGQLARTVGLGASHSLCTALAARLCSLGAQGLAAPPALAPPASAATPGPAAAQTPCILAHLGDGDFLALLPLAPPVDRQRLQQQAQAWLDQLQAPVSMGELDLAPEGQLGLAVYPDDAPSAQDLMATAQAAAHQARPAGAPMLHSAEARARLLRVQQLESGLRHAVARGELGLLFQAQVSLVTGEVMGAEALLRWHSAELGEVGPGEFIPVAEHAGLMTSIGRWVLREVCAQTVRWRRAGLPPLRVALNLSPVQFQLGDLAHTIRQALADTGAEPTALALELTESALQHGGERVVAMLKALRNDGIQVVLDDFGTGASSLSSLRRLAIDLVKVDRSFVRELTHAPESASVTRSVIQLAHALHLPVLAEGVETEGQLQMLRDDGCDQIQGYLFSPPLDADGLAELLRSRRTLPVPARPERRRTLLLVDDEAPIISALKRLFRRDGYQLLTANSGAEALELLASHPVDVIVSDQRMPGMTGVDFLRRTKALHPDTIRMTLSGFADLQSIIDAVNEGAVYKFLMKPWDDNRLREHVAQAFAQKELADDNRRLQAELGRSSAEQAELAQRLAQLLARQTAQAHLIEAGALTLRGLVDALPLAVLGVDPDGLLALANPAAQALLPAVASGLGLPVHPDLAAVLEAAVPPQPGHPGEGLALPLEGRSLQVQGRSLPPEGRSLRVQGRSLRLWRAALGPLAAPRLGPDEEACADPGAPAPARPEPTAPPQPRGQLLVLVPDPCPPGATEPTP